ncbi:MAG TPA: hypothetical protein VK308_06600, partial [Pyrinomonadaceae bacterium]|nr:hypothetical protein [Pyrinomonadaceae bacterium]
MKRGENNSLRNTAIKISAVVLVLAVIMTSFYLPFGTTQISASNNPDSTASLTQFNRRSAPNFDLNESRNLAGIRPASNVQLSAFENLKQATNASNAKVRWNEFGGSPDVIYDFASAPSSASPEDAARAFLSSNSALFGIADVSTLRVFTNRAALGGHLIRFQQTVGGIDVKDGGIGIVMNANKQVIMASGPYFRDVNVNTTPTLSSDQARNAADADLQQFQFSYPGQATQLLQTGLGLISEQAAAANNIEPKLGIYPTADGYKLVWKIAKFSTNPFGLYMISVDAHTGEIIARKDFVHFQQAPGQETADIFPKYPDSTDELKNQGIISVCNGAPCGQQRVTLRKFHPSNRVSGLNGTLTGTHALVNNALATKQPFAQAGLGTWHFRENNPARFEGRTNELDHFAEPAEHQDEINAFFFTTYLLEYVDHLHIGGDNGTLGGRFPDDYPNKTNPLP